MYFFIIRSTAIISIFISLSVNSFAADIIFSSSFGYNSNPTLDSDAAIARAQANKANNKGKIMGELKLYDGENTTSNLLPLLPYKPNDEPEGSFFSTHTLSLGNEFTIADKFLIGITPSVTYQNFFEISDNHQFNFDLYLSPVASGKRFTPYIFTSASFYRDSMLKLDSRDEFTFGAGGEIILSGRYTLAFEHSWQKINYLEDSPIFAATGREFRFKNVAILIDNLEQTYSERNDVNMMLKTQLDIFLLPDLNTSIGLEYGYLVSSLDAESFWQLSPDINVEWNFATQWKFVASARLERKNFFDIKKVLKKEYPLMPIVNEIAQNNDIINIREINYTTALNLRLSYFLTNIPLPEKVSRIKNDLFSDLELFAEYFAEHGQYPINSESYNLQVIQCGFSWSF